MRINAEERTQGDRELANTWVCPPAGWPLRLALSLPAREQATGGQCAAAL